MKIGIIGDTHFGCAYSMGRIDPQTQLNTRLLDFSKTFNKIIDDFVKREVKIVVLTGDIFETRHPTSAQLSVFSMCVRRATDLGLKIIANIGNHDQQRNISTTTLDAFNTLKLPFLKVFKDIGVYKADENTNIILMPYRDRRMIESDSNLKAIQQIESKLNSIIKTLKGKKIVVGHFMLEKSPEGFNSSTFSLNELVLPIDMFRYCDAVIMGHIHKHEVISLEQPIIVYSGSMDKVSFGERDHQKVSLILDSNNLKNIEIIKSKVRNLFEINLDYLEEKVNLKDNINNRIIKDIEIFSTNNLIKDSIIKIIIKVKENDLYYVKQSIIKNYIASKNIKHCAGIHITSVNTRQLRNSTINETLSGESAFIKYVAGLSSETESMKKKLLKFAQNIIKEVENR